jgi:arginine/lysine/ornithine decarboxylase
VEELYEELISYTNKDYYPMHMPGHKRNTELLQMDNPYGIDITEIEGFDNLHQPEGILRSLSERLARLYGAGKSYPLVNGSTAGILAGISAAAKPGDTVLIARNCHKSVYHGAMLRGLKPIYCYPQKLEQMPVNGGILPENIKGLLMEHPETRLVVITSPTYEGIVSDIRAIAEVVHRYGALLFVDEAHGAHFGFHNAFPKSAVTQGADIIIQSLHKTLPAMTQSAVLHCNRDELNSKLQKYLAVYQSSSPSYVLLAGIDRCICLLEKKGTELFEIYYGLLREFYASVEELSNLKIVDTVFLGRDGVYDIDPSKLTITVHGTELTGHELQVLLREQHHIELEMASFDYVLGMTSIADTREGLTRFAKALLSIDRNLGNQGKKQSALGNNHGFTPEIVILPGEAMESQSEAVKFRESAGKISAAFISQFPPGAPLLVPGERIDQELVTYIDKIRQEGITITGLIGESMDEIEVVKL